MKQNLKYGIIVLFTILLHSLTMKAADVVYAEDATQQECFISQPQVGVTQISHEHFHLFGISTPCEIGHADISHISTTDKSFHRPEAYFRKYMLRKSPSSDILLHINKHSLSDPLTYYVYELRKIII